jgi:hypothetical protein
MMGEACLCIDIDNDVGSYELKRKIVTARKNHVCTECNEEIKPDQKYELVYWVYDFDNIETFKTCIPCKNVRDDLFECGFYYTMLWENLEDHFRDVLPINEFEDEVYDFKWLKG